MPQTIEVIKGFAMASEHEDCLKETLEALISSAEEDRHRLGTCWGRGCGICGSMGPRHHMKYIDVYIYIEAHLF